MASKFTCRVGSPLSSSRLHVVRQENWDFAVAGMPFCEDDPQCVSRAQVRVSVTILPSSPAEAFAGKSRY